jgi:hypothetical protein
MISSLDLPLSLSQHYGQDMLALGLTPQCLLMRANESSSPIWSLLSYLDHIGGYKEDPLRKKPSLLAIILQQQPEQFLADDVVDASPVFDYHIMRTCLRTGLIDVNDKQFANKLIGRELLLENEESAIRMAVHSAIEQLVGRSGKRMGLPDWFFSRHAGDVLK